LAKKFDHNLAKNLPAIWQKNWPQFGEKLPTIWPKASFKYIHRYTMYVYMRPPTEQKIPGLNPARVFRLLYIAVLLPKLNMHCFKHVFYMSSKTPLNMFSPLLVNSTAYFT
jgi:hypothetical protein